MSVLATIKNIKPSEWLSHIAAAAAGFAIAMFGVGGTKKKRR